MFLTNGWGPRFPCVVHTVADTGVEYYEFFIHNNRLEGAPTLQFRERAQAHWVWLETPDWPYAGMQGVTPADVQAAYYAYLTPATDQQETVMTDTPKPAFEVVMSLSTGTDHSWSIRGDMDTYEAYAASAELFDNITRQQSEGDKIHVLSNTSVEYWPSSLVTSVAIHDRRSPEEQKAVPFNNLVRRYASGKRHTLVPVPAPSVTRMGDNVWIWWDETGAAGGVGSTEAEAREQLDAYVAQLDKKAEPENEA